MATVSMPVACLFVLGFCLDFYNLETAAGLEPVPYVVQEECRSSEQFKTDHVRSF